MDFEYCNEPNDYFPTYLFVFFVHCKSSHFGQFYLSIEGEIAIVPRGHAAVFSILPEGRINLDRYND